jgi:hypothetical protein
LKTYLYEHTVKFFKSCLTNTNHLITSIETNTVSGKHRSITYRLQMSRSKFLTGFFSYLFFPKISNSLSSSNYFIIYILEVQRKSFMYYFSYRCYVSILSIKTHYNNWQAKLTISQTVCFYHCIEQCYPNFLMPRLPLISINHGPSNFF